jgi:uncharacterized protein
MKYLLIFLVVLLLAWRWRSSRSTAQRDVSRKKPASAIPQDMVRCTQCGVHIPANEAVLGTRGSYCSAAHRQKTES